MGTRAALFLLYASISTQPVGLHAQVSGTVVDSFDEPLAGVEVLAWGTAELLSRSVSDSMGAFSLDVDRSAVRRLSVHHASAPTTFIYDFDLPISIELATAPIELEGVSVRVEPVQCTGEDEPEARAALAAAAADFSAQTGYRGLASARRERSATTTSRGLPAGVPWETQSIRSRVGSTAAVTPGRSLLFETRVDSVGYARYSQAAGIRPSWPFPALQGSKAYHFATPSFATRQAFWVESDEGRTTTVAFCPRSDEAGIRGRIHLRNGQFDAAEWTFLDENRREAGGGGSVQFWVIPDEAGSLHLLAASGSRWRTSEDRDGQFVVVETRFEKWDVSSSSEAPPYSRIVGN